MQFATGWYKSKTLWSVTFPGILTAIAAGLSGEMTWPAVVGAILAAIFATTVSDTIACADEREALRHEERMAAVNRAREVNVITRVAAPTDEFDQIKKQLWEDAAQEIARHVVGDEEPEDGECDAAEAAP